MRSCRFCGEQATSRTGPAICADCKREAARKRARKAYRRKHGTPDGKRRCRRCGRSRPYPDQIRPLGRTCFACQRKRTRQAYHARQKRLTAAERNRERRRHRANQRKWRATPEGRERHAEGMRKWRREQPRAVYEAQKRWRKKMMLDPKRHAEWKENQRIYHRIWRERNGQPTDRMMPATNGYTPAPRGTRFGPMVPAEPLTAWLRAEYRNWPIATLAEQLGEDDRHIGRLINGEQRKISLHVVDRILVHADSTYLLPILYPSETV